MDIEIFTLDQAQNIGAFLQAFSMQELLEAEGHTVAFARLGKNGRKSKADALKKICRCFFSGGIAYVLFKYRAARKYAVAAGRLHRDLSTFDETKHFDMALIGSDEIWNVKSDRFQHYPQYFAHQMNAGKRIAYAACAGNLTVKDAETAGIDFSDFNALSVRDDQTAEVVRALTGKEAIKVCDPTLLIASLSPYIEPVAETGYILVYSYGLDKKEIASVKRLAKATGKKLISVATYNAWCDRNIVADPFEFLGWLSGADFVVTSTFHGTALSIKLGKQFAVFPKTSQKLYGLLKDFGFLSRIVTDENTPEQLYNVQIDYDATRELLEHSRVASMDYLKNALRGND